MQGWHMRDVTGDGHEDMIGVHQLGNNVYVYPGDGLGTFGARQTIATGRNHGDAAFGDFNEDGRPDMVLSQPDASRLQFLPGAAGGLVAGPAFGQGSTPRFLDAIDYNHDGHLDLLVYLGSTGCLVVRVGDGLGGFAAAGACVLAVPGAPYNAYATAVVDWDGDGFGDIAEGYAGNSIQIWRTTGTGLTALLTIPITPDVVTLDTLDRNRDGVRELAVLGPSSADRLRVLVPEASSYRLACSNVGLPLSATAGMQGVSSFAADVDEDGIPDAVWRSPSSSGPLNVGLP